MSIGADYVTL